MGQAGKNRLLTRALVLHRRLVTLSTREIAAVECDLASPPGGLALCQAERARIAAAGRLRDVEADWLDTVLDGWERADLGSRFVAALTLGGRSPRH